MVSNLNSILIEGVVIHEPFVVKGDGKTRCSFLLESLYYKKEGRGECEGLAVYETHVWITVRGEAVKDVIKSARNGRGARVVGRLASDFEHGKLGIEAEHIEFRPEHDKEGERR